MSKTNLKNGVVLLLFFVLTACQKAPSLAFEQDAYIWQRQWTPLLRDAMHQSSPYVNYP
jgi:hypothetical protein